MSELRTAKFEDHEPQVEPDYADCSLQLVTSDRTSSKGLWAIKLTRELWKRQIWTEAKAVEIMKEAALSENEKVIIGGVRFFLGGDKEREDMEDESSDDEGVSVGQVKHQLTINKKTRKKARAAEKAIKSSRTRRRRRTNPIPSTSQHFTCCTILKDLPSLCSTSISRTKSQS